MTSFADILYFFAVFGGPILLALALAYGAWRVAGRRMKTPRELRQEGRPAPPVADARVPDRARPGLES